MAIRSWIRKLFARPARTVRKALARFRPRIKALEDRVTPSKFYVTNSNDDLNPGSLRAVSSPRTPAANTARNTAAAAPPRLSNRIRLPPRRLPRTCWRSMRPSPGWQT